MVSCSDCCLEFALSTTQQGNDMVDDIDDLACKYMFNIPAPPAWSFTLANSADVAFHCDKAPNWLHRKMQWLMLGITWKRL